MIQDAPTRSGAGRVLDKIKDSFNQTINLIAPSEGYNIAASLSLIHSEYIGDERFHLHGDWTQEQRITMSRRRDVESQNDNVALVLQQRTLPGEQVIVLHLQPINQTDPTFPNLRREINIDFIVWDRGTERQRSTLYVLTDINTLPLDQKVQHEDPSLFSKVYSYFM